VFKLMNVLTPSPILNAVLPSLSHTNWRVREEVLNVVILAISSFPKPMLDFQRLINDVVAVVGDSKTRVKGIAIETLAVINNAIGTDAFMMLISRYSMPEETVRALYTRLKLSQLPAVSVDGLVEHVGTVAGSVPSSAASTDNARYDHQCPFPLCSCSWALQTAEQRTQGQAAMGRRCGVCCVLTCA
jgi:hypothetical protein